MNPMLEMPLPTSFAGKGCKVEKDGDCCPNDLVESLSGI